MPMTKIKMGSSAQNEATSGSFKTLTLMPHYRCSTPDAENVNNNCSDFDYIQDIPEVSFSSHLSVCHIGQN